MTTREFNRVKVIEQVIERRLTAVAAAQQLQLTSRQIGRLVKRYRDDGPQGLVSKLLGKRSNRAHAECFKKRVVGNCWPTSSAPNVMRAVYRGQ